MTVAKKAAMNSIQRLARLTTSELVIPRGATARSAATNEEAAASGPSTRSKAPVPVSLESTNMVPSNQVSKGLGRIGWPLASFV